MATAMSSHLSRRLTLASLQGMPHLPEYVAFDDLAAMAVLATLTMLYLFNGTLWNKPDPFLYKMYERPQQNMPGLTASKSTRDIGKKFEQTGADIVVFWGSQSGTAESFANRLSRELRQRFGKQAFAADVSDFDPQTLSQIPSTKLAIFIVSTYGEGEPSDNVNELWSWLGSTRSASLAQLRYAAFGLGNSNYKYYNAVVDFIVNKFDAFGAQPILPTGKADDAKGETEENYLDWKASVFEVLKTTLAFEEHDPVYEPSIEVTEASSSDIAELHSGEPWTASSGRKVVRTMSPNHALPIKSAKELFSQTDGRNCIHMELDLSANPGLKYKTGDHLGVWPMNPTEEVDTLLRCLGKVQSRHQAIKVTELLSEAKVKVPSPATLDSLFGYYLEVCAPVSRETITSLIQFAPSGAAKEMLSKFSTDQSSYAQLLDSRYVTLGRLLELTASTKGAWSALPLSFVIEVLPAMRPRYYSISSSSVVQPRQVAITAVVADKALVPSNERISGLCTNYLLASKGSLDNNLHPYGLQYSLQGPNDVLASGKLFAHVRKSTFKLPTLSSHPIIMVGAGTGVAPFRAFLQERARLAKMGRPVGRTILIFGCRNEDQDFIYQDELREIEQSLGSSLSVITAISRPSDGSKMYVQDRVRECSEEITDLLVNNDANFYICGSATMARDVSKVLASELERSQNWSEDEVSRFMEKQRKTRRWQQDVWG